METHPYGWLSLTPPMVAIVLAIATRRIVLSLLLGILAGALVMSGGHPLVALGHTWETHLWSTLIDPGKLRMFSFTLLMGAMIGVITRAGGMQGLVQLVSPYANTRRRGQLSAWMLGVLVFFDDYANTMLLGSTLQPVFRRLKISREKLAYLVDSTAAPVAALAPLSTWVAIEIDSIASGLEALPTHDMGAFQLFLASVPYRFYVWMALFLVPMSALLARDFGTMVKAERRTLEGDDEATDVLLPEQPQASSWLNAMLPIAATVVVVIYLVYSTGARSVCESATEAVVAAVEPWRDRLDVTLVEDMQAAAAAGRVSAVQGAIDQIAKAVDGWEHDAVQEVAAFEPKLSLQDIFGAADSSLALQYAALVGLVVAMAMSYLGRLLKFDEMLESAYAGARVVLPAVAILWCAAAMSRMTRDSSVDGVETVSPYEFRDHRLYTADYLTGVLAGSSADDGSQGLASVAYLPTVVFLLAGVVAFCTGTSWGTMGILLPMVVQTAHALLVADGIEITPDNPILVSSIGGVLAGAVFGDHCSPISDTTVLSSQWSGCDHLAHVWTQLPYALLAAAVSVLFGTLPLGICYQHPNLGVSVWALLPLQLLGMFVVLRFFGRQVVERS